MIQLWRQRPKLTSAFVLASALTLFFAARFLSSAIYWANPAHQNQTVQGWMTIGYVAQSWHLKADQLDALARLPGPQVKGHPQSIREVAKDRGVSETAVIAEVEKAIMALQAKAANP